MFVLEISGGMVLLWRVFGNILVYVLGKVGSQMAQYKFDAMRITAFDRQSLEVGVVAK